MFGPRPKTAAPASLSSKPLDALSQNAQAMQSDSLCYTDRTPAAQGWGISFHPAGMRKTRRATDDPFPPFKKPIRDQVARRRAYNLYNYSLAFAARLRILCLTISRQPVSHARSRIEPIFVTFDSFMSFFPPLFNPPPFKKPESSRQVEGDVQHPGLMQQVM